MRSHPEIIAREKLCPGRFVMATNDVDLEADTIFEILQRSAIR